MKPIRWCDDCGTPKTECDCPTRLETALWWLRVWIWNPIRAWRPIERLALMIPGRPRMWALKRKVKRRIAFNRAVARTVRGFEITPEWYAILKTPTEEPRWPL